MNDFEKNVGEMLFNRSKQFGKSILIHEKKNNEYIKTSLDDIYNKVIQIGSGLISAGITKKDKIAVVGNDCNDILALELACMSIGCTYVPIYSGYYPKQMEYVLSHSDPKYLILSDESLLEKVLSTAATGRIEKYFLINYNEIFLESTRIFNFSLLIKEDNENIFFEAIKNVDPQDVCLLLYTSGGTTGIAKGVQITHEALLSQQKAFKELWQINSKDIILSYFPWHRSLGIIEKFLSIYSGATLAIDRSPGLELSSLIESLESFKPTICFGDASIYYDLIQNIEKSEQLEKAFFHQNLKFVFSASSPSNGVIKFFEKKNVAILQGWGMTETLQYVTVNTVDGNWQANTSGFPIPGVELKIEGDSNEIYLRGKTIIKEYYKDEEKNDLSFTEDGWFKTGDAGILTENGLIILGRIDSVFYLNNESKVYASKIEDIIENSSIYVSNCVLFGQDKTFMGLLIFPNHTKLLEWYKENNGYVIPISDMLDEKEIIDLFKEKLKKVNEYNFDDSQKIKYFSLIENPPSIKAGELTSAHTIVRKQVLENYKYLTKVFYLEDGFFPELKSRIIEV